MCGIYGYVGHFDGRDRLVDALCILNQQRGHHSAGLATVSKDNKERIHKSAMTPYEFAKTEKFIKMIKADNRVLIGHTRFATHGTVCRQNAHPFRYGGTTGVHNGMVGNLENHEKYCNRKFAVDSESLIYSLDTFGDLGLAAGSLNVLYFTDKSAADLNVIRWNNPLSYAIVEPDDRGMVFSSDSEHLEIALEIAKVPYKEIKSVPDNTMWKVYIRKSLAVEYEAFEVPFAEGHKPSKYSGAGCYGGRNYDNAWVHGDYDDYGTSRAAGKKYLPAPSKVTVQSSSSTTTASVTPLPRTIGPARATDEEHQRFLQRLEEMDAQSLAEQQAMYGIDL